MPGLGGSTRTVALARWFNPAPRTTSNATLGPASDGDAGGRVGVAGGGVAVAVARLGLKHDFWVRRGTSRLATTGCRWS